MIFSGKALQTLLALVLSALWAIALGLGHWNGDVQFLDRAEAALTDLRMLARGEKAAPGLVTIVAIDDDTVARQGGYPLPRAELAAIVDAIARLEPRVVAVDLLLLDHGSDDGDAALARALERRPAVIASAAVFPNATQLMEATVDSPLARLPQADKFLLPLQTFADHAAVGVVNLTTDRSGTPRGVPMLFRTAGQIELSFPLRVAALASGAEPGIGTDSLSLGQRKIRTDIDHVVPLAYYGRHGTIRTISAGAVLNGDIAPDAVRDRIVVIGATVTGGGDVFATPFDPVMPGVEIIATSIANLMTGDGLVRDRTTRLADAIIAIALTLLLVGLLAWRRNAIGLVSVVIVPAIWLAGNFAAFSHGIWLSAALPVAAAGPPAILFGAVQLWLNRRRAQYFAMKSDLLQQFQAPALRKWLTRNPDFLLEPVHQDAAIIFIDLSGFTSLSETLGMDSVLAMLNDFHTLVDREVRGARRRHHQLSRRRRHDPVRPAREHRGRRPQCRAVLRRPLQPGRAMDRIAAAVDRIAHRLQDRRPFRPDRRLPSRRRQLSAHHRDRRQRQCGEPIDGGCRAAERGAGTERRPAAPRRPRMRAV